jgi:hypothetical protein
LPIVVRAVLSFGVLFQLLSACGQVVDVGLDDEPSSSGATSAGRGGSAGSSGNGNGGSLELGGVGEDSGGSHAGSAQGQGGAAPCQKTLCRGQTYKCGNCMDDDGDGKIDSEDPDCLGPCDDDEKNLRTGLTVGNAMNCREDCYFDGDAGPGNDKCVWSHVCDTLSVAPDYPPSGDKRCAFDPSKAPAGTTCAGLKTEQQPECLSVCLPLVPNGCDCFGCCELPAGSNHYYFLGATAPSGTGCELDAAGDPTNCPPCTPVPSCLNKCEPCENCVGRGADPNCQKPAACPSGQSACASSADCAYRHYCVTGCCVPPPPPT